MKSSGLQHDDSTARVAILARVNREVPGRATHPGCGRGLRVLGDGTGGRVEGVGDHPIQPLLVGLYPIATLQQSSTISYQIYDHIQ